MELPERFAFEDEPGENLPFQAALLQLGSGDQDEYNDYQKEYEA